MNGLLHEAQHIRVLFRHDLSQEVQHGHLAVLTLGVLQLHRNWEGNRPVECAGNSDTQTTITQILNTRLTSTSSLSISLLIYSLVR